MSESALLLRKKELIEQRHLITKIKNPKEEIGEHGIRAMGPTDEFPLPWVIESFPGLSVCSIVSVGGGVRETVISIISREEAKIVLQEIEE